MDLDTECIPLGHMQTYFDLRKGIILEADWLNQRSQLSLHNPHEIIEVIIGIDQQAFYRNAKIDYRPGAEGRFISTRQCLALVGQAVRSEEHTSELQSRENLVCRLLLEKKKDNRVGCYTQA